MCVAEDLSIKNSKFVSKKSQSYPGDPTVNYFGWGGWDPVMGRMSAQRSNDGMDTKELTHKQIATKIRKEYAPENLKEKTQ